MARGFNGTNQYLENNADLLGGNGTLSCWCYPTTTSGIRAAMSSGSTTNAQYRALYLNGFSLRASNRDATVNTDVGAVNTFAVNNWIHAAATFDGVNMGVVLNGDIANKGTIASTATPVVNKTVIGGFYNAAPTPSLYFQGNIAHAAAWNTALTDTELKALSIGVSPLLIRPQNLTHYWPLAQGYSPENDVVGGSDMTLFNAPAVADNPPLANPNPRLSYPPPFTPLNYFPTRNKRMAMIGNIFMPTMVLPDGSFTQEGDASQMLGLPRNTLIPILDSVAALRPGLNLGIHVGL